MAEFPSIKEMARQVAEEAMDSMVFTLGDGREFNFREFADYVVSGEIAPVRHGRWMKMTGMMPPEYHGHYECSECQWHMKGLRNSWTREEELTYCPNCGAKMDGGEANDTV